MWGLWRVLDDSERGRLQNMARLVLGIGVAPRKYLYLNINMIPPTLSRITTKPIQLPSPLQSRALKPQPKYGHTHSHHPTAIPNTTTPTLAPPKPRQPVVGVAICSVLDAIAVAALPVGALLISAEPGVVLLLVFLDGAGLAAVGGALPVGVRLFVSLDHVEI